MPGERRDPLSTAAAKGILALMLVQIDPVLHSVHGLAGGIHEDYRAEVIQFQPLGGGWRRVYLRLLDDAPKPPGARRRPTIAATVIVPETMESFGSYRVELWRRIERGVSLTDVRL